MEFFVGEVYYSVLLMYLVLLNGAIHPFLCYHKEFVPSFHYIAFPRVDKIIISYRSAPLYFTSNHRISLFIETRRTTMNKVLTKRNEISGNERKSKKKALNTYHPAKRNKFSFYFYCI